MGRGNNDQRRTDKNTERIDTVRAEDMEDRDSDVRGTTTERYTVAPPVNVVHDRDDAARDAAGGDVDATTDRAPHAAREWRP